MCMLFGSSTPFAAERLTSLYGNGQTYLERFDASLEAAIAAGFVRAAERDAYAAVARGVASTF